MKQFKVGDKVVAYGVGLTGIDRPFGVTTTRKVGFVTQSNHDNNFVSVDGIVYNTRQVVKLKPKNTPVYKSYIVSEQLLIAMSSVPGTLGDEIEVFVKEES